MPDLAFTYRRLAPDRLQVLDAEGAVLFEGEEHRAYRFACEALARRRGGTERIFQEFESMSTELTDPAVLREINERVQQAVQDANAYAAQGRIRKRQVPSAIALLTGPAADQFRKFVADWFIPTGLKDELAAEARSEEIGRFHALSGEEQGREIARLGQAYAADKSKGFATELEAYEQARRDLSGGVRRPREGAGAPQGSGFHSLSAEEQCNRIAALGQRYFADTSRGYGSELEAYEAARRDLVAGRA